MLTTCIKCLVGRKTGSAGPGSKIYRNIMTSLKILHLEDNAADAEIVWRALRKNGIECDVVLADAETEYLNALERGSFDVILADNGLPGFNGLAALKIARQ